MSRLNQINFNQIKTESKWESNPLIYVIWFSHKSACKHKLYVPQLSCAQRCFRCDSLGTALHICYQWTRMTSTDFLCKLNDQLLLLNPPVGVFICVWWKC